MKDNDLDTLLARGRLSGSQREAILERVLDRTVGARPRRMGRAPRAFAAVAVTLSAAAAVALVVGRREQNGFVARGGAGNGAHVEATCVGGSFAACPRGGHLVFHAWAGERGGFLAAYAEPAPSGERVWYFSAETAAPRIEPGAEGTQVPLVGVVGTEQPPGRYTLYTIVSSRPLSRDEILAYVAARPRGAGSADVIAIEAAPIVIAP